MSAPLSLSDIDFELPDQLIAREPLQERDASRLLHLGPDGGVTHRRFRELPELLLPGDLLVFNDTKVFPARLIGKRAGGGRAELLLLERLDGSLWRTLVRPGKKLGVGKRVMFAEGALEGRVETEEPEARRLVRFRFQGTWDDVIDRLGVTPLPPYVGASSSPARSEELQRRERYQTVYARETGSVAAPTAGLHFTQAVFDALETRGIGRASLTHHVGYATFEPMRSESVAEHRMGEECFTIPEDTVRAVEKTQRDGGRVVAVGTTTVRALESAAADGSLASGDARTRLFITPGHEFRVVQGLLTNFHLPKSTLFLLVSALGGLESVKRAYRQAVTERYRFYSFGDCMLLWKRGLFVEPSPSRDQPGETEPE